MKKSYQLLASALVVTTLVTTPATAAFASSIQPSSHYLEVEANGNDVLSAIGYGQLSPEKEKELQGLGKEFNMTTQDLNDVKALYLKNAYSVSTRWKVSAIIKVAKVAGSVMEKAGKTFGIKVLAGKTSVKALTNFLTEWEGKLQDGIEVFLVNRGWPRTAAYWTAKTIVFVAF